MHSVCLLNRNIIAIAKSSLFPGSLLQHRRPLLLYNLWCCNQARRQKIFQGGATKKDRKLAKNTEK